MFSARAWTRLSTARATASGRTLAGRAGFTLVEIMIVMAIIVTILSIAVPFYQASLMRAKEAVLRSNLFTMRSVIDQYTYDKERPPQSLQELVDEGYLRELPLDPFTESRDTWQVIVDSSTPGGESGVWNVKSGSDKTSLEGTPYSEW